MIKKINMLKCMNLAIRDTQIRLTHNLIFDNKPLDYDKEITYPIPFTVV